MIRLIVLALVLAATPAVGDSDAIDEEITYLLGYITDSGCAFTRNSTTHTAAEAADHLRLKYSRGRRWVDSAEDFIDRLASASSWTDRPYTITCAGKTENTGPWLHRALDARRSAGPAEG